MHRQGVYRATALKNGSGHLTTAAKGRAVLLTVVEAALQVIARPVDINGLILSVCPDLPANFLISGCPADPQHTGFPHPCSMSDLTATTEHNLIVV